MTDSDDTPEIAPSDMTEYLAAYDHYAARRYDLAHAMLLPIVLEYPNHVPLNQLFVACLLPLGRNFDANKHVQKIYQNNPGDTSVMLLAAQTYSSVGARKKYREILRDIVALAQNDRSSLLADAYLKSEMGLYQKAYSAYVRIFGDPMQINYGPEFGRLPTQQVENRDQYFIPLLVKLRRIDDAQILVDKSLMLFPDSKYVLMNAAWVAKIRGDFRAVWTYLSRAKVAAPDDPHVTVGLAVVSLRCFRFKESLHYFRVFFRLCMNGAKQKRERN